MQHRSAYRLLALVMVALLGACGGGSSGDPQPAPIVSVLFPTPSTLTGATQLTVVGVAPDPSQVMSVSVNGVPATSGDAFANWQATVPLGLGSNAIRVSVSDGGGAFLPDVVEVMVQNIGISYDSIQALGRDAVTGEFYVLDAGIDGLYTLSPSAVVSDATRGGGDPLTDPEAVVIEPALDRAFVVLGGLQSVLAIDLTTGARTTFSDTGTGTGDPFVEPRGAARFVTGGALLVADRGAGADGLVAVSLLTGDRILFSGSTVGLGTDFSAAEDVATDEIGGRAFVADSGLRAVFQVDLLTGDRTVISDDATGIGPFFDTPRGIAYDPAGDRLFIADAGARAVFRVDLANGNRFLVSDANTGSGPLLAEANDLELGSSNSLLVADKRQSVIAVDLATGNRAALSSGRIGVGPDWGAGPWDVAESVRDGMLYVAAGEGSSSAIFRVNPATSGREVVSSLALGTPYQSVRSVAVNPQDGEVYALDSVGGALYSYNPVVTLTRERSADGLGTGPTLTGATDIVLQATGARVFCVNPTTQQVLSIAPAQGNRTVVSGPLVGAGPSFVTPVALALDEAGGRLFVSDTGLGALVSVDISTGDRAIIADGGTGAGPALVTIEAIEYDAANGRVEALDRSGRQLLAVDLGTGDRTVLQTSLDRGGPSLRDPVALALGASAGRLYLVDARVPGTETLGGGVLLLENGVGPGLGAERVTISR